MGDDETYRLPPALQQIIAQVGHELRLSMTGAPINEPITVANYAVAMMQRSNCMFNDSVNLHLANDSFTLTIRDESEEYRLLRLRVDGDGDVTVAIEIGSPADDDVMRPRAARAMIEAEWVWLGESGVVGNGKLLRFEGCAPSPDMIEFLIGASEAGLPLNFNITDLLHDAITAKREEYHHAELHRQAAFKLMHLTDPYRKDAD